MLTTQLLCNMEIVCIEKKAFDEICSHLSEFEDRLNRLCNSSQDFALKNWMDNQDVCKILRIQPTLNNERFLTDEELSKILRVSRRTLQEYRSAGTIPYYLVQGKALYKESEIEKILNDSHKRCVEEQRWV